MVRGNVKWFNQTKGFGFIEITSGDFTGKDVFVHAADVEGNPLRDDDEVEFDIDEDDRTAGKKRASRVTGGTGSHEDRDRGKGRSDDRYGGKGDGKGKGSQMSKPGDWDCNRCGIMNFASRDRCFKCGADKPYGGRGRGDSRGRGRAPPRRDSRRRSRSRGRY